jgi:hypothetical protein
MNIGSPKRTWDVELDEADAPPKIRPTPQEPERKSRPAPAPAKTEPKPA